MNRSEIKKLIRQDYVRQTDDKYSRLNYFKSFLFHQGFRTLVFLRKANSDNKLVAGFNKLRLFIIRRKYGNDILPSTKIGGGLYLMHLFNITISPFAEIGMNVNILKGATIGLDCSSKRRGAPKICNNVFIGFNVTIVGKVTIGDDVIFAPNTFCNFDVPSHSVVIGNPGRIIPKENATKDFVHHLAKD